MDYIKHYESPLGGITMASDGQSLIGLWFDDQEHFGSTLSEERQERDLPVFRMAKYWLDSYFSGRIPELIPPIKFRTTKFRKMVCETLLTIPYGKTVTYSDIARRIARRTQVAKVSAQAVGGAVGHNPISLIVPCHRVIGVDGSLTGYAGGLERKRQLIKMEKGGK